MNRDSEVFEFRFPDIGEGLTEGTIVEVRVKVGDRVRVGDTLAVVETDKVVTEIPSPRDGLVAEIRAAKGLVVKVGEILAIIETGQAPETASNDGSMSIAPPVVGRPDTAAVQILPASQEGLPREPGASSGKAVPQKLSTVRVAIARAMEKSQAIPSAVIHDYTVVDEMLRIRRETLAGSAGKVGILPFFLKAAALSLRDFPLLNSTYDPQRMQVETHGAAHIGVAVDTEEGLVVPVIRDVAGLSLSRIQEEIARLAGKARARLLAIEEIRGGTFTVTNYGAFAGTFAKPMILPPQVAILGIGRIHDQPIVREGAVTAAPVLPLSLVFDHRVIDGVYAGKFLNRFMELVSKQPRLLL